MSILRKFESRSSLVCLQFSRRVKTKPATCSDMEEAEIDEFVITTVGRISSSDEDDTFRYKSVTYKKLIHWDGFNRLIREF